MLKEISAKFEYKNPSIVRWVGNPLFSPNTQPVKADSSTVCHHHDQICDKPEGRIQSTGHKRRLPVQSVQSYCCHWQDLSEMCGQRTGFLSCHCHHHNEHQGDIQTKQICGNNHSNRLVEIQVKQVEKENVAFAALLPTVAPKSMICLCGGQDAWFCRLHL